MDVEVPPMEQIVSDVSRYKVVDIIRYSLISHIDIDPMLTKLVYVPLEVKDLLIGEVFLLAQLHHCLSVKLIVFD
jgi:hypothetical protein